MLCVFHCIFNFLGMQLQLLNVWSILHFSISSILYFLCLGAHCAGSRFIYLLCIYVWSCLSVTLISQRSLKTKHWWMRSAGTVWQLFLNKGFTLFTINFMAWFACLECCCGAFQTLKREVWWKKIPCYFRLGSIQRIYSCWQLNCEVSKLF